MNVTLAGIHLEVADPQRSKRFYIDGFGMNEHMERSHAPAFVYLQSGRGDITLAAPHTGTSAEPSRTMELGFAVDDLPALQERLAAHGITGFRPQRMVWGDVLEGADFDGYRIVVYQLR